MDFKQRPSRRNTNIDGFIRAPKKPVQGFAPRPVGKPFPGAPVRRPASTALGGSVAPSLNKLPSYPVRVNSQGSLPTPQPALTRSRSAKPVAQKRWKRRLKRSVIAGVLLFFLVGGWLGSRLLGNVDKVFHGNIISDVQALSSTTKLAGESTGRVNILLAGDSADDPNHAGADLTDSIMVVSIDTVHHTGFMLSIPRDTWVDIPGYGHEKINGANDVSNFNQPGYPHGGMGQLQEIVTNDFGIPINYSALIDYTAFRDAVNAVGGITIPIQSTDPRGLYDAYTHLKLPNGPVTLNGQQALDLARARGDNGAGDVSYGFANSDYDRTKHQRQMLTALEQKALSAGVLTNPLRIGQLVNTLGNNVHTNLNLADILRFTQITKGMNVSSLQSLTLGISGPSPLLKNYVAPDGEEALIPAAGVDNYSQIQNFYQTITSGVTSTAVSTEAPTVVVLNASNVTGLAKRESQILAAKGYNVVGVTDANSEYPSSMIVNLSAGQKPASLKVLNQTFASHTTTVTSVATNAESNEAHGYNADFVVVLGKNWDGTPPSSP